VKRDHPHAPAGGFQLSWSIPAPAIRQGWQSTTAECLVYLYTYTSATRSWHGLQMPQRLIKGLRRVFPFPSPIPGVSSTRVIKMERIKSIFSPPNSNDGEYEPLNDAFTDDSGTLEGSTYEDHEDESPFLWIEYGIFALVGVAMLWAWYYNPSSQVSSHLRYVDKH